MSYIWVVLLDVSASMGQPFEGEGDFRGHVNVGDYSTKLAAAKDRLVEEAYGLGDGELVLIAFSDSTNTLYAGPSGNATQIAAVLDGVVAGGHTNIGSALDHALKILARRQCGSGAGILMISDALSTMGDLYAPASRCKRAGIRIDTILIDPTPEGQELASGISERVHGVRSGKGLAQAVQQAASTERQAQAQAEAAENQSMAFVYAITACVTLSAALPSAIQIFVEKPGIAGPIAAAVIAIIGACFLFMIIVSKRPATIAIYSDLNSDPIFREIPRYSEKTRRWAKIALVPCLLSIMVALASAFSSQAAFIDRSSKEMQTRTAKLVAAQWSLAWERCDSETFPALVTEDFNYSSEGMKLRNRTVCSSHRAMQSLSTTENGSLGA